MLYEPLVEISAGVQWLAPIVLSLSTTYTSVLCSFVIKPESQSLILLLIIKTTGGEENSFFLPVFKRVFQTMEWWFRRQSGQTCLATLNWFRKPFKEKTGQLWTMKSVTTEAWKMTAKGGNHSFCSYLLQAKLVGISHSKIISQHCHAFK